MSSEKSMKTDRYAQYYLVPQSAVRDDEWLMTLTQPESDWLALDLTGQMVSALGSQVQQVVNAGDVAADEQHLPYASACFDLVVYQHRVATHSSEDRFDVVREAARLLKPGGRLIIHDLHLPDDEQAAHYVNAFYRFRYGDQRRSVAAYEWQGMMLDAGLHVADTHTTVRPIRLADWSATCTPYVMERLHLLLQQAPSAVADHLRPFAIGTPDAMFTQMMVAVVGQKPEA